MIVARQVGPMDFGPYAASFALTRILAVAFSLDLDTWLLRNGFREGDYSQLTKHSTSCLTIKADTGHCLVGGHAGAHSRFSTRRYSLPSLFCLCALTCSSRRWRIQFGTTSRAALRNQQIVKFIISGQASSAWRDRAIAVRGSDSAADYLLAADGDNGPYRIRGPDLAAAHARLPPAARSPASPTLRGTLVFASVARPDDDLWRADVAFGRILPRAMRRPVFTHPQCPL